MTNGVPVILTSYSELPCRSYVLVRSAQLGEHDITSRCVKAMCAVQNKDNGAFYLRKCYIVFSTKLLKRAILVVAEIPKPRD